MRARAYSSLLAFKSSAAMAAVAGTAGAAARGWDGLQASQD